MKISVAVLAIVFVITMCKVIIERSDKPEQAPKIIAKVRQYDGTIVTIELSSYYFSPEGRIHLRTDDGHEYVEEVSSVIIVKKRR